MHPNTMQRRFLFFMILFIFFIRLSEAVVAWNSYSKIRIGQIQVIRFQTTNTSTWTNATASYSATLNGAVAQSGLSLIGYESYLTQNFAFNATIYQVSTTSITVSALPMGTTYLNYANFMYIVTASSVGTEVVTGSFLCLNLAINSGARSELFGIQTSVRSWSPTIIVQSFVYAFNMTNAVGAINYLNVNSWVGNDSKIYHNVSTDENCTVEFICLTTITLVKADEALSSYGYVTSCQSYSFTYANNVQQIVYYPRYDGTDLRFYGFSSLYQLLGNNRLLQIFPTPYSLMMSTVNLNNQMNSAILQVFQFATRTCTLPGQFYDPPTYSCVASCSVVAVGGVCQLCFHLCLTCNPANLSDCNSCFAGSNRNNNDMLTCSCSTGFYQNNTAVCPSCSSSLTNCTACNSSTYCSGCAVGFYLNLTSHTCTCSNSASPGYIVNGICLNFPGCTQAYSLSNFMYCQVCDNANNFQIAAVNNLTCICKTGFNNTVNPLVCSKICGIGITAAGQCDDNNTISGDGCSSTCTIEAGYHCSYNTTTMGISTCVEIKPISIKYLFAQRIEGTNKVMLNFDLLPLYNISSSSFDGNIFGNIPNNTVSTSYDSSTGRMVATIEFTSNLEDFDGQLQLTFANLAFYADPLSVSMTIEGVNQKLLVENYAILTQSVEYFCIGLSILAIVLAIFCSIIGYKMIGIQLFLPIQMIFYSQFTLNQINYYFSQLKYLKYSNLNIPLFSYNYEKYYQTGSHIMKLDYQAQYFLNTNISLCIQLVLLIILIVLNVPYFYYKNINDQRRELHLIVVKENQKSKTKDKDLKDKDKNKLKNHELPLLTPEEQQLQTKEEIAKKRRNYFMNNLFVIFMIFMLQQVIFGFVIQNSQINVEFYRFDSELSVFCSFLSFAILVGGCVFLTADYREPREKKVVIFEVKRPAYPVYFIMSYFFISLITGVLIAFSFAIYITLALCLIPLLVTIICRPYKDDLLPDQVVNYATISSIFNQLMLFGVVIIFLVNQILPQSEMFSLIATLVIVFLILLAQILTVIRMIKTIPWRTIQMLSCFFKKKKGTKHQNLIESGKALKDSIVFENDKEVMKETMMKRSTDIQDKMMINWEEKNKKQYESITSQKKKVPEGSEDEDENDNNSDQSEKKQEPDELTLLKQRLRKQMQDKWGNSSVPKKYY